MNAPPPNVTDHATPTWPLWSLPLLAAVTPLFATHVAWLISIREGFIPDCIPYLDGCTSISRAARHGLGNQLFRLLMLPCAALQGVFWLIARGWLARLGVDAGRGLSTLGLVAAVFLGLYATFLGSEGEVYSTLRRYGVTVYFAATYLALLVTLRKLSHQPARDPLYRPLLTVALGFLAIGLASVGVSASIEDATVRDRWENILEWHLGLWLTAMFLAFTWRWRRERLALAPSSD